MEINHPLDGIALWRDPYAVDLAIMDHLSEIQSIKDEMRKDKNMIDEDHPGLKEVVQILEKHFIQEQMDLFILLQQKFDFTNEVNVNLYKSRKNKFMEKSKNG
jgi:hypothetical protein